MSFASEDFHDKCRDYLERKLSNYTIDNIVLSEGVAAVGELTLFDPDSMMKKVLAKPDIVLFDRYGNPLKVVEYKTGVGQRKKAELQLRRDQELLYRVFQSKPRMVYACGTPNSGISVVEVL